MSLAYERRPSLSADHSRQNPCQLGSGGVEASLIRVSPSDPSGRGSAAELEVVLPQEPTAGDASRIGGIAVEEGDDPVDEDFDRRAGAGLPRRIQVAEFGSKPGLPSPRLGDRPGPDCRALTRDLLQMDSRWDHEFAAVATRLPGCRAPRNQFQVVVHEPTWSAVA